jgi:hypothetical protein
MDHQPDDEWLRLCQLAATEQDPDKLLRLVEQITGLLKRREESVRTQHAEKQDR